MKIYECGGEVCAVEFLLQTSFFFIHSLSQSEPPAIVSWIGSAWIELKWWGKDDEEEKSGKLRFEFVPELLWSINGSKHKKGKWWMFPSTGRMLLLILSDTFSSPWLAFVPNTYQIEFRANQNLIYIFFFFHRLFLHTRNKFLDQFSFNFISCRRNTKLRK